MPAALLLVAHQLAIGGIGLHVVERSDGLRGGAERRVGGDVVDTLAADIDRAAVAQRCQMLFSGAQHKVRSLAKMPIDQKPPPIVLHFARNACSIHGETALAHLKDELAAKMAALA